MTGDGTYLAPLLALADYLTGPAQQMESSFGTYGGIISQPTAAAPSVHRQVYATKQQAKAYGALTQVSRMLRKRDASPARAIFYQERAELARDFAFRRLSAYSVESPARHPGPVSSSSRTIAKPLSI